MKTAIAISVMYLTIFIVIIVGEVKCIIKAVNCNWDPIGKAEIVYTAAALTGIGSIVGYINIDDK